MNAYSDVRPIKIKIQDVETKEPIKKVKIYYYLEISYFDKILWIIPKYDPVQYKYIVKEEYASDSNGIVNLDQRKISLGLYEYLYREMIVINLDLKNENNPSNHNNADSFLQMFHIHDLVNVDQFYNPITEYRGFVLYSGDTKFVLEEMGGNKRKKFNIKWNTSELNEPEFHTIELERW